VDSARFTRCRRDDLAHRADRADARAGDHLCRRTADPRDDKVYDQTVNVAALPGIVGACYVMPDAHWGYGFPIGGVAAFDADAGGVVSAGGVGFDISCGVRTMLTGLSVADIRPVQRALADTLFEQIPAGVGSKGSISLDAAEMDAMLLGGAEWAVARGWGEERDLERIEEGGRMAGAEPRFVSDHAKQRQRREMGTLGSGNHYLEVQSVEEIFDAEAASARRPSQYLQRNHRKRAGIHDVPPE
jgi:tRNA-splicing ligase RtcB (3'-phosphate/5'-hydroxy nucleic acid ligase)